MDSLRRCKLTIISSDLDRGTPMTCELCGGAGIVRWMMRLGCVEPLGWDGEPGDATLLDDDECPACAGSGVVGDDEQRASGNG
jgi:hypothetical protein